MDLTLQHLVDELLKFGNRWDGDRLSQQTPQSIRFLKQTEY
jgi:hypothetical protein